MVLTEDTSVQEAGKQLHLSLQPTIAPVTLKKEKLRATL